MGIALPWAQTTQNTEHINTFCRHLTVEIEWRDSICFLGLKQGHAPRRELSEWRGICRSLLVESKEIEYVKPFLVESEESGIQETTPRRELNTWSPARKEWREWNKWSHSSRGVKRMQPCLWGLEREKDRVRLIGCGSRKLLVENEESSGKETSFRKSGKRRTKRWECMNWSEGLMELTEVEGVEEVNEGNYS